MESDKVKLHTDAFDKWISEGIIEEVEEKKGLDVHYLPHRPVIKKKSGAT